MTDLDKLATLDDLIVNYDQEELDAIEQLLEQRTALNEVPTEEPEIELPPEPEPQIEPPKEEEPLVQPVPDPLADIRGMTAKQIDKKMNKKQMIDLIEQATGERRPQRTKAADLAAELERLAR